MDLKKYKYVIWDFNGTLIDDAWLCVEIVNQILAKRDQPKITLSDYRRLYDFPLITFYQRIGFDFSKESFHDLGIEFLAGYDPRRTECPLQKGAPELLNYFSTQRVKQFVLSAYEHKRLEQAIEEFGILHYFQQVSGLQDHYAESKIDNAKALMETLDCEPREVLFAGDTTHDFEVAREIGTDCVLTTAGHHNHTKLSEIPVKLIDDFTEIIN